MTFWFSVFIKLNICFLYYQYLPHSFSNLPVQAVYQLENLLLDYKSWLLV